MTQKGLFLAVWTKTEPNIYLSVKIRKQMTPKGLYLDSGSNDDVTWETGISGTKGLSIIVFSLHKYWTQQRYINMPPKKEGGSAENSLLFINTKIVYYFYKRKHQKYIFLTSKPTMQVSQKSVFLFNYYQTFCSYSSVLTNRQKSCLRYKRKRTSPEIGPSRCARNTL